MQDCRKEADPAYGPAAWAHCTGSSARDEAPPDSDLEEFADAAFDERYVF